MPRKLLILLGLAAFLGGFHEWTPPAHASTPNFCTESPSENQFNATIAQDNQPPPQPPFIVAVTGDARLLCTTNWRVTFQPLYKLPASSTWSVGFDTAQTLPSATGHYNTNQDVLLVRGTPPMDVNGYWTSGDGLRASHPICQYQWRVRERFTNTGNGTLEGTLYTPTVEPTC